MQRTLLETALHQELTERGVTCLSVDDCRAVLDRAYARAARMNRERQLTKEECAAMTRRAM